MQTAQTAIWNTMHDGTIVEARGTVPGDVELTIDIQYLCEHMPERPKALVLKLLGCKVLEFTHSATKGAGAAERDLGRIAALEPEILSAQAQDDCVEVTCVSGVLRAVYTGAQLATSDGKPVAWEELDRLAADYWSAWEEAVIKARGQKKDG